MGEDTYMYEQNGGGGSIEKRSENSQATYALMIEKLCSKNM